MRRKQSGEEVIRGGGSDLSGAPVGQGEESLELGESESLAIGTCDSVQVVGERNVHGVVPLVIEV